MAEESDDQGDKNVPKDEESSRDEPDTADDEEETVGSDAEDEDDEGEEEEPKLKYARLTSHLVPVYRNGDATSCFLVAGDKMVSLDGPAPIDLY
jgi:hypothetical protein